MSHLRGNGTKCRLKRCEHHFSSSLPTENEVPNLRLGNCRICYVGNLEYRCGSAKDCLIVRNCRVGCLTQAPSMTGLSFRRI